MSIDRSLSVQPYDQVFVVNGYQLSGVDSISINYSVPLENSLTLGSTYGYNLNNPVQAEISLQRSMLYQDPLLAFTGDSSFSGSLKYNGKSYGFTKGFLNRYSISCTVGEIPSISCSISVYGELKPSLEVLKTQESPSIFIPSPRSILVSGDNTSNNRVKSFSFEYSINRQSIFSLDSAADVDEVVFLPPINVAASLTFDAVNMTPDNYDFFLQSAEKKNFDISVKNRDNNSEIIHLTIPNIQAVSQELSSSSDSSLAIVNNYIGFLE
jgi:hypothetical protein